MDGLAVEAIVQRLQLPRSTALALKEQRTTPRLAEILVTLSAGGTLAPEDADVLRACGLHTVLARGYELAFARDPQVTRACVAARAWRKAGRPRDALRALAMCDLVNADARNTTMALTGMAAALVDLLEFSAARAIADKAISVDRAWSDYPQRVLAVVAKRVGRSSEASARRAQADYLEAYRKSFFTPAAVLGMPLGGPPDDAPEYVAYSSASEQRKVFNRTRYAKYLSSDAWIRRRNAAVHAAGRACERCGLTGLLHVHHLTYWRVFNEIPSDLEVLCPACHAEEHDSEHKAMQSIAAIVGPTRIAGSGRCVNSSL